MSGAEAKAMRIVIVTGVSGAGKSTALRALEDAGYFCVDNLPLPLMNRFIELLSRTRARAEQAALGVDAREGEFLVVVARGVRGAAQGGPPARGALPRRRRRRAGAPLLRDAPAPSAVGRRPARRASRREREILRPLREEASAYVDTANLNVHQLTRRHPRALPPQSEGAVLAVTLLSFGFKHGLPAEADIVLDVRFLPNPYFVEALSASTGEEASVREFVLGNDDAREFLDRSQALLEFVLPRAEREGKAYLTVAVGCTGGRHRSVAVVQELAKRLPRRHPLTVRHRDLARGRE